MVMNNENYFKDITNNPLILSYNEPTLFDFLKIDQLLKQFKCGGKTKKKEVGGTLNTSWMSNAATTNKGKKMIKADKCGSKVKKHFNGGYIYNNEALNDYMLKKALSRTNNLANNIANNSVSKSDTTNNVFPTFRQLLPGDLLQEMIKRDSTINDINQRTLLEYKNHNVDLHTINMIQNELRNRKFDYFYNKFKNNRF